MLFVLSTGPVIPVSQLNGYGRISSLLKLSLVSINVHNNAVVSSAGEGATGDFVQTVDFGNLSQGSGLPAIVTCTIRLQGNAPYKLNISELNYQAKDLRVRKKDVSGTEDGGSFIAIKLINMTTSGSRANPQLPIGNARLLAGMSFSDLTQGQVSAQSTTMCSGPTPSLGGTSASLDNGVDVLVNYSVPTGLEVGPVPGAIKGSFQTTVQMGAFAGS